MPEDRTMIRVSHVTKAAMDAIAAKMRAANKRPMTDNDIIWYLIEQVDPEIAMQMREIADNHNGNDDEEGDES